MKTKNEAPEQVVTIENVLKLLVKLLKPTIDNSDAETAKVSTVVTSFEDGKKYNVEVIITPTKLHNIKA